MLVRRNQLEGRPGSLGFTVPGLPTGLTLPDWLKDWRVWAAVAVVVVVLMGLMGGKAARKRRRKRLMAARLKYAEEVAKIRRTV